MYYLVYIATWIHVNNICRIADTILFDITMSIKKVHIYVDILFGKCYYILCKQILFLQTIYIKVLIHTFTKYA